MESGCISREFTGAEFFAQTTAALNAAGLRAVTEERSYLDTDTGVTAIKPFESADPIKLYDFNYSYGKHKALSIPELEIPTGSVCAVVGHNVAGKSTFVKALCGLQKGFKGTVQIGGKACRPRDMRCISYMVMQDVNHQLFAESVLEEAMLGMENEDTDAALEMLRKLGIAEYKDRHPMSLSGGQKQRTAIASALLAGKKLLIFDEPTSGLDFRSMELTAGLLAALGNDCTVLIVTHDMELIGRCCTAHMSFTLRTGLFHNRNSKKCRVVISDTFSYPFFCFDGNFRAFPKIFQIRIKNKTAESQSCRFNYYCFSRFRGMRSAISDKHRSM